MSSLSQNLGRQRVQESQGQFDMENGQTYECVAGISPLDSTAKNRQCGHAVLFYKDAGYLLDEVSKFIGSALRSGDSAIVIGTEAHRDGLSELLCQQGLDVGAYIQSGSYVEMDAESALLEFMVDGAVDPERYLALLDDLFERVEKNTRRGRPVAVFGEIVSLLWKAGKAEAAIGLEELWNTASRTHAFSLLCAYPFDLFPGTKDETSFQKVCARHTTVVPGEDYSHLPTSDERLRKVASLQQRSLAFETASRLQNRGDRDRGADEEESLRRFSSLTLRRQEEERRRVGEDLLDILGQYLSVLKMKLDSMRPSMQGQEAAMEEDFDICLHLVEESVEEVRSLSYLVYPPLLEEAGLSSAIPWYVNEFSERSGIKTELYISPDFRRVSNDADVALFRVLQEALTNVQRHSGSATAEVRLLTKEDSVALVVRDAGKGLPPELLHPDHGGLVPTNIGIRTMRERMRALGGKLEMATSEKGVTITATIPIPFCAAAAASA